MSCELSEKQITVIITTSLTQPLMFVFLPLTLVIRYQRFMHGIALCGRLQRRSFDSTNCHTWGGPWGQFRVLAPAWGSLWVWQPREATFAFGSLLGLWGQE